MMNVQPVNYVGTLKKLIMPLQRVMLVSLMISSVACQTKQVRAKSFDAEWKFMDDKGITRACLTEPDVIKLMTILMECK